MPPLEVFIDVGHFFLVAAGSITTLAFLINENNQTVAARKKVWIPLTVLLCFHLVYIVTWIRWTAIKDKYIKQQTIERVK